MIVRFEMCKINILTIAFPFVLFRRERSCLTVEEASI